MDAAENKIENWCQATVIRYMMKNPDGLE